MSSELVAGEYVNIGQIEQSRPNNLVATVKLAFGDAMAGLSGIDPDVLAVEGMSGRKYRLFINNLIRLMTDPSYLEVGSWMGSTLCSAMSRNKLRATAIDNWSEFGGPKDEFMNNVARFISDNVTLSLIESDFRLVNYSEIGRHNVFLFDGPHSAKDQYDGIAVALPALHRQFVLIVDDWNWQHVREGTLLALSKLGLSVQFALEIRSSMDNSHPKLARQTSDWHNGYFIGVIENENRSLVC
jgi:Methyltransferase domain